MKNNKKLKKYFEIIINNPFFIISLFAIFLIIRIIYLDADPSFLKQFDDVGDEGYWAHNARNAVLFGRWIIDDYQALAAGPLFSVMVYSSFKLFGVGLFQDRLVSVVAGWLTLVLLYFFIKKAWNKKAAVITVLLLGFNNAFLMYNRLGLVESSMIFFLVFTLYLWYKGNNWNGFYFFSGLIFALAIITKLTSFYFAPAMIILWIFEHIRNTLKMRHAVYFIIGTAVPLLFHVLFFLIPCWCELYPFLSATIATKAMTIFTLPLDVARVPFRYFFGLPSVFLLLVPLILYLVNIAIKINYDLKGTYSNLEKGIQTMSFAEIAALSWIIGGGLSVVLVDLFPTSRRLVMFTIPITILFTKILLNESIIDLNKTIRHITDVLMVGVTKIRVILFIFVLLPLYSFIVFNFPIIFAFLKYDASSTLKAIVSSLFTPFFIGHNATILQLIFALSIALLLFISMIVFLYLKISKLYVLLTLTSIGCLIAAPLSTLVKILYHYFSAITEIESGYLLIIGITSLIPFFYFFFAFIWRKNLLKITPKFICSIILLYFMINFAVIGIGLTNPTFTIAENSKSLQKYIGRGDVIIGPLGHELAFENEAFPLFYVPHSKTFGKINQNVSEYNPKFLLISETFAGKPTNMSEYWPALNDFPNVIFVKKIELCPYPFTDHYKTVLNLYKIGMLNNNSNLSH